MTPSTSEGGLPPPPHRMELRSHKGGAEAQREGVGGSIGRTAEGGCTAEGGRTAKKCEVNVEKCD